MSLLAAITAISAPAPVDPALPIYDSTIDVTGTLVASGADKMQDLVDVWSRAFKAHHPHSTIVVNRAATLSADGFAALLGGQADLVTFVREPFAAEIAAFTKHFGYPPLLVHVAGGSYATKGGTHAIAIYINAANPLTKLTLSQLDAIFSKTLRRGAQRTIATWGQLGLAGEWSHRPIHVYGMLRQRGTGNPPGVVNFMKQRVLLDGEWRDDLREQIDKTGETALDAIVNRVAADPAGIGYSGFAYATAGAKTVALGETIDGPFFAGDPAEVARRDYPLSRQIYLSVNVVPGRPLPPLIRAFLRFVLSHEGQQAIALDRTQYIPLTAQQAAAELARITSAAAVDPQLPHYQPQLIAFPAQASYVTPEGAINIVGYNDMHGMLTALDALFVKDHPGFKFALDLKGTRTAPPALMLGDSAFAPMGAEFSDADVTAYRKVVGTEPLLIRIAHDSLSPSALSAPLAFYVHHSNPLNALTIEQAARAFTMRGAGDAITRWGQLGLRGQWMQSAIHLCGVNGKAALGTFMQQHKFGGQPFAAGFAGFPQSVDVVKCVSEDPLAIGFAAINRATSDVKVLGVSERSGTPASRGSAEDIMAGRYPLDRHLYIYVRQLPGQAIDPFVREYLRLVLSFEGQQAIAAERLGYLRLNAAELAKERAKLD